MRRQLINICLDTGNKRIFATSDLSLKKETQFFIVIISNYLVFVAPLLLSFQILNRLFIVFGLFCTNPLNDDHWKHLTLFTSSSQFR